MLALAFLERLVPHRKRTTQLYLAKMTIELLQDHPAAGRYRAAGTMPQALLLPGVPEDDAAKMLAMLRKAVRGGTPRAVCCQLAYSTTSRAFELLCAHSEERGLVFVNSVTAKVGAVFYDRDPTWQHEIVSGRLASEVTSQLTLTDRKLHKLLMGAPSPRVKLPSRSKEPDFAWAPKGQLAMDGRPTAVLEVAVFHESEEELLAEGSEWLSLPETQVAFLVNIKDELNPPEDCPAISLAVFMKDGQDIKKVLNFKAIGKASSCVEEGLEECCCAIPWASLFHGSLHLLSEDVLAGHFLLDMYDIRDSVREVYRGTRLQREGSLTGLPLPSTSTISFEDSIANSVKKRRRTA